MFGLFLALSASLYVPYSETMALIFDSYSDKQFGSVLKKNSIVVACFINISADGAEAYLDEFSKLPTVFSEDVKFCVLECKKAKRLTRQYATYLPQISFFIDGHIQYSIPFPSTEMELLSAVDVFIRPSLPTFTDEKTVYESLGETSYTFICTQDTVENASDWLVSVSDNVGSFNIVQTTPDVMKKMKFSGEKVLLYRKADKIIKELANYKEFVRAIYPTFYPKFDLETIANVGESVGLLCVEESATKEQKDMLANLGSKFPGVVFGIINDKELDEIHIMTGGKTRQFPCFLVVNWPAYVYYPTTQLNAATEDYINDIINGTIKEIYPSEAVPTKQEDPFVTKVVGSNYKDFVSDTANDVIMFYIGPDKEGLRDAHKIGKYITKNNIPNIKVGYIITSINTCKDIFPRLVFDPQINFFPAHDKKIDYIHFGAPTVYSILEGLKKYSKNNISLNYSQFRFSLELIYLVDLIHDITELHKADRARAEAFIIQRGKMLSFGTNLGHIVNAVYNAAGGLVAGFDDEGIAKDLGNEKDDFVEPDIEEELTRQTYREKSSRRAHRQHRKSANRGGMTFD